ncbi:MAG TPA: hypothetical protein VEK73_10725, partial [Xanthobacteraceae bacterium]|nr:hypothetical protein [Xanthobacteraceae bacterium]
MSEPPPALTVAGSVSLRYAEGARPHGDGMTAIDFAAFVDQLAAVSGEAILPFFRTALSIE